MCDKNVNTRHDNALNATARSVMQNVPSREETLGDIVMALLRSGQIISKRTLCLKLIARIETATDPVTEAHLNDLLKLILRKNQP